MKLKNGTIDPKTGKIFWAIIHGKELWLSKEKFLEKKQNLKDQTKLRKIMFVDRIPRKVGEINPLTGKVFWRYAANCKDGEWWVSPEKYEDLKLQSLQSTKRWQNKNPERTKKNLEEWKRKNYSSVLSNNRCRRSLRKEAIDTSHDMGIEICLTECCRRLKSCLGNDWEIDHIVPLSKNGKHHHTNLQILPAYWNRRKYNKKDFSLPK